MSHIKRQEKTGWPNSYHSRHRKQGWIEEEEGTGSAFDGGIAAVTLNSG